MQSRILYALLVLVAVILIDSLRVWVAVLRGTRAPSLTSTPADGGVRTRARTTER